MKPIIRFFLPSIVIVLSIVLTGCSSSPEYGKYQYELSGQIQDMMNVLNSGHYSEFMSTYVSPSYINSKGGVNAALLYFDTKKQKELLNSLRTARNIPPVYNEEAKTMTYISTNLSKPLTFKMENGKWYITGEWFIN